MRTVMPSCRALPGVFLTQLVAFYEDNPIELRGRAELHQEPMSAASGARSTDGVIRPALVYIRRQSEAGPFLVPFAEYDDWSLRDRYNEAIRIMNTLGAATITCETFREVSARRGLVARVRGQGPELSQQRVENSGFDFRHEGAGSGPRDPRPLRWPDEPGFAAAVSSVLDNGAREVVINIRSNRSFSVDSGLGASLRKLGFELGASAQRASATSLHIRASFPQVRRTWR